MRLRACGGTPYTDLLEFQLSWKEEGVGEGTQRMFWGADIEVSQSTERVKLPFLFQDKIPDETT